MRRNIKRNARGVMPKKNTAAPAEHWEKRYSLSNPSKNMVLTKGADFNPKCPDERKTTHLKVNSTDH